MSDFINYLFFVELEATDSQMQQEVIDFSAITAQHLRFFIESGHDHFTAVYKVRVDGSAVHG